MSNSRCCARCRTPYNCGNPACTCHATTAGPTAQAWAAALAESATERVDALYHMDEYRGNRDPNSVHHGLGDLREFKPKGS